MYMNRVVNTPEDIVIVGENIHTTRVVKLGGVFHQQLEDGADAIKYRDAEGNRCLMRVPEHFKKTQPYEQGQLKHFMIAVWKGMNEEGDEAASGVNYIEKEVHRQAQAGSAFLDLNVDEFSYRLPEQIEAMKWLVGQVQKIAPVPPSIDSSKSEIIEAGFETYDGSAGRPMLNSVALERIDALDLVLAHSARVVVTAAKEDGMPENEHERLENVGRIVEAALSKGIALSDIFVDPLFFPISVSGEYGPHGLNAIRLIREEFGPEIHITGGMSNVSFGLPNRKLVNEVFVRLAIDHGADSGIVDPNHLDVQKILDMDMTAGPVQIATDMLMGKDDFCMNYISAFRAGDLG
jgi:5-methyltetrahydrofolate corrinoid/iron sulfur protein methyltransferase